MSSFGCPHLEAADDRCKLLQTDCVPGRNGCLLSANPRFAFSAEERIRLKKQRDSAEPFDRPPTSPVAGF
ncbi:MAG: hypothetical protein N3B01_09500 [Verrucomicrobiae bacterium]|nr:hypothetical protein [Verrucomicrobiae bacterium]